MKFRLPLLLALSLALGCDQTKSSPAKPSNDPTIASAVTTKPTANTSPTSTVSKPIVQGRVASNQSSTVGHIRVSIKKVSVGPVPLKDLDGSINYTEEPRLMIALRIENIHEKRQAPYDTWVPDLEAAKTFAILKDDKGKELKRITFGFGNNVKDRTVLDTLTPGKVISDLLVFEVPAEGTQFLDLDLPGANCRQRGTFQFRIEAKDFAK